MCGRGDGSRPCCRVSAISARAASARSRSAKRPPLSRASATRPERIQAKCGVARAGSAGPTRRRRGSARPITCPRACSATVIAERTPRPRRNSRSSVVVSEPAQVAPPTSARRSGASAAARRRPRPSAPAARARAPAGRARPRRGAGRDPHRDAARPVRPRSRRSRRSRRPRERGPRRSRQVSPPASRRHPITVAISPRISKRRWALLPRASSTASQAPRRRDRNHHSRYRDQIHILPQRQ